MHTFKFRIHTGPVIVRESVARMRKAGIKDVHAGTEHAYGTIEAGSREDARERLSKAVEWRVHAAEVPSFGEPRSGDARRGRDPHVVLFKDLGVGEWFRFVSDEPTRKWVKLSGSSYRSTLSPSEAHKYRHKVGPTSPVIREQPSYPLHH